MCAPKKFTSRLGRSRRCLGGGDGGLRHSSRAFPIFPVKLSFQVALFFQITGLRLAWQHFSLTATRRLRRSAFYWWRGSISRALTYLISRSLLEGNRRRSISYFKHRYLAEISISYSASHRRPINTSCINFSTSKKGTSHWQRPSTVKWHTVA